MREEKEPFNIDTYVYLTTYGHKDVRNSFLSMLCGLSPFLSIL